MKILIINEVCGVTSTGRICAEIAEELERNGHTVRIAYGRYDRIPDKYQKYAIRIGTDRDVYMHAIKTRVMDRTGFGSTKATKRFIEWLEEFDPDIINIHNLHGYYINIKILFDYLKNYPKKIFWTLHDCWSFTGHCVYFDYCQCEKWKNECNSCPQRKEYPSSMLLDNSRRNYMEKKQLFTSINNMIIITPSEWLKDLVGQSYLKKYETVVINNGIDTNVFSSRESELKNKYSIENKKVILGVASIWDRRKGLKEFYKLAEIISEDYQIVIIGLTKKQVEDLPDSIIGIERTENTLQLAEWYSLAEVFVNPTFEDNYPTTNLEALSCGTPVITYHSGGSGEMITKETGVVLSKKTPEAIWDAIQGFDVQSAKMILKKDNSNFSKIETIRRYLELFT